MPAGHTNNPHGISAERRRALKSLALTIRDGVDAAELRDWLEGIRKGKDPVTGELVDLKTRMLAAQMLLDRGWGQAAQHVVLEGAIRQELIELAPPRAVNRMSLAEINARRATLRASLAPVIDVPNPTDVALRDEGDA